MPRSRGNMKFQTMRCVRCGDERVLGCDCDNCGFKCPANEVNANVVRRRSAVIQVQALVDENRVSTRIGSPVEISEIMEAVGSFTRAIRQFADTDGAAGALEPLANSVREIEDLRARALQGPFLRPRVEFRRAVAETVIQIAGLWGAYKAVFTSSSLGDSQKLAARAQRMLDGSSAAIRRHSELAANVTAFEDLELTNFFERALVALRAANPGLSFLEIASIGAERATAVTGGEVSASMGAQYLTLKAVADVHLDSNRFDRIVAEASSMTAASSALASIASHPGALLALANANRLLTETLRAFEAVIQSEIDEDALLRRFVRVYGEVFEDVGLPLFAWYLLAAELKSKPFEKLLEDGATDLANSLLKSSIGGWFLGVEPYLRNAAQHGASFSISGAEIDFKLKSKRGSVAIDLVIDVIFALFESLGATAWALNNSLSNAGLEVPVSEDDAAYMGISGFRAAQLWLANTNVEIRSFTNNSGNWDLQTGGHGDVLPLALALAQSSVSNIQSVLVHRANITEERILVPIEVLRKHFELVSRDAHGPELLVSVLAIRCSSTRNGSTLATNEDFEYVISALGLFYLNSDLSVIPLLREVNRLATSVGNSRATSLIARIFEESRAHSSSPSLKFLTRLNGHVSTLDIAIPSGPNICVLI